MAKKDDKEAQKNWSHKNDFPIIENQQRTIIKAIGIDGGGINAVNRMYLQGIEGVTFVVLDTDSLFLNTSPVPNRVLLRSDMTHRGAAEERESEIAALFDDDTKMVIIIAGLGGGIGTCATPVVARIAHEECLLTVGIVTIPFQFEGFQKDIKAHAGIQAMGQYVDAMFAIDNQCLTEIYNDLDQTNAFAKSDETLATAVRSLCDLIMVVNRISIDFNDVNSTLRKGGNAIIISGYAVGERRVTRALEDAFESPLLKGCDIYSSRKMMMNFYYNPDSESPLLMEEMNEVQAFMENFGQDTDVIWGMAHDKTLDNQLKVTVLASGFNVSYKSQIPLLKDETPSK